MTVSIKEDFYGWTVEQAGLLRAGRLNEADMEHIAEELEDMGASERSELRNRLSVLLMHLLKWIHQPERRGRSWALTVAEQRVRIRQGVRRNPGLKPSLAETVADAYEAARLSAARETGLELTVFPETCPWTFEEAMTLPVEP